MTKEDWKILIEQTLSSLSIKESKDIEKIVNKIQNNFFHSPIQSKEETIIFSKEQLKAINCQDKYILLKARAGSGKTAIIVERVKRILESGVSKNEILLLAFNKEASLEIGNRISQKFFNFDNSKTFHSFAWNIINPEKVIFGKEQETFLQKIILENRNSFLNFKTEIKDEISSLNMDLSKKDFIQYIRKQEKLTFNGFFVKSNGEKWISDFLFEHNISFKYEKRFDWNGKSYHPDFEISPNIILEHWGIDENQIKGETPKSWNKTFSEYKNEMQRKREFWSARNELFIETSILDLKNGREHFENILKLRLEKAGVVFQKLSIEEIYNKLQFQTILKITNQVNSYIANAKQKNLSHLDLKKKISLFPKNKDFLLFANLIFEKYENSKKFDFLDLLKKAIENISKKDVSNLKYLLIDEFQDFSPLFYELINKIKTLNPKINIFAVGDDWQSINGFAGSDLKYFNNFQKYFPHARILEMNTNYRSLSEIVNYGNKLLKGKGKEAIASQSGGTVKNIKQMPDLSQYKKVGIIVRNNYEKKDIPKKKNYEIITAHKSKGLEFDVIVIWNKDSFKKLHKDNKLSEIFGKTKTDILNEEKRLFYVASTRAKEKLYII